MAAYLVGCVVDCGISPPLTEGHRFLLGRHCCVCARAQRHWALCFLKGGLQTTLLFRVSFPQCMWRTCVFSLDGCGFSGYSQDVVLVVLFRGWMKCKGCLLCLLCCFRSLSVCAQPCTLSSRLPRENCYYIICVLIIPYQQESITFPQNSMLIKPLSLLASCIFLLCIFCHLIQRRFSSIFFPGRALKLHHHLNCEPWTRDQEKCLREQRSHSHTHTLITPPAVSTSFESQPDLLSSPHNLIFVPQCTSCLLTSSCFL